MFSDYDKDELITELQKEIDSLKTILSMMPGNISWRNKEGFYLGCNNNLANILHYSSPAELVGKRAIDAISPELATQVDEIDLEVITSEKEKSTEENGLSIDGKPAIYLTRKSPFYDRHGNIQGLLSISFDITERKEIEAKLKNAKEKAEAANRAKSQFLAMISHELRTPLTSILGFANFLTQTDLALDTRLEYTNHIVNSGTYLLSLINSLLDYNKLENNKFELVISPLNFKTLMESIVSMLNGTAKLKKLSLNLDYDDTIPEILMTDNKIFQQILINLAGNAIKFTEEGHVTVEVKCLEKREQSVKLYIAVEDTGIGIPVREQQAIFKRFYQLENVYTRNESLMGTGLGLAIVKKLASLLNSKVSVKSAPNKGSTFSFVVDLNIATADDIANFTLDDDLDVVETETCSTIKPYVLLVEDDQLIQIIHKHMLEELGCKVDVIASAKKTLEMLDNNYDVLLVDIGLPDMAGFELIKTIRGKNARLAQIPIIVLTGYSDERESDRYVNAGANEIAIKPVSHQVLEEILNRALKKIVTAQ